ncbi:MAG TPA: LPS assembly lipoprotein LptE [Steroidobacteraceae bacterium]|nr:LPS assembly lipoprotein LptE [Steroidobacteraceae bacterium]
MRATGSSMLIRALGVLLLASVAGCGWQLQGRTRLPEAMSITYVDAKDRYSDFTRELETHLRASGARLVEQSALATASIRVLRDESGQRVLSISARNTPQEYEVYYIVEYAVSAGTTELLPTQRLELTRDYTYDEAAVLAKQREEASLRAALARDLAAQVLRRVASL